MKLTRPGWACFMFHLIFHLSSLPLRIVLVEPREAGNVGAAARAMKNFGFSDLAIAGEPPALNPVAGWWASGAEDLVSGASFHPTLASALQDAHLTVATTSTRGRELEAALTPSSLADLYGGMPAGDTLALVFGREDRGLTSEELSICQRVAAIPTSESFPTMNLAQSVSIFCYELSRVTTTDRPAIRELATAGELERLHHHFQALLVEAGFLHQNNPDRIYSELRMLAGRLELDRREVTLLLGIIRQLEWRMAQADQEPGLES